MSVSLIAMRSGWIVESPSNYFVHHDIFFQYYTRSGKNIDPQINSLHLILHNATIWLHQNFQTDYTVTFTHLSKLINLFRLDEEVSTS